MPTFGTWLLTRLNGKCVGTDEFGNRYYVERKPSKTLRDRRWVIYPDNDNEASRVPPRWHRWLHHISDDLPGEAEIPTRPWEQEHQPNPTGTENAYRPPGSALKGGQRARGTGDYEPWTPS
ncbi:MAG: NADH:ubiquinone oxidoreductase subunit NDUFA12 [Alphaproteobacteria bacterium]|nr:NADH:ubiquinone oxidoreductase subunit NDUFA12 [Alphaproteobacteria bacterium]